MTQLFGKRERITKAGAILVVAVSALMMGVRAHSMAGAWAAASAVPLTGTYLVKAGDTSIMSVGAVPGVTVLSTASDPLRKIGWTEVTVADATAYKALAARVQKIEPNTRRELPKPIPSGITGMFLPVAVVDPWVGAQWQNVKIGAPSAWARGSGEKQTVAVIDTGIDCSHGDLFPRLAPGYDATQMKTGCTQDKLGHGTHVSGAVAAAMNGAQGAGVAWLAKIMPVACFTPDGWATDASVTRSIVWAMENGATVMNLSLGSEYDSTAMHEAIIRAVNAGITVVVAAGNGNSTSVGFPASYPEVITVGATDQYDKRASFSNYGPIYVNLGAPGVETFATTIGGAYGYMSGTSMSSPVVAGAVAVLQGLGVKPNAVLKLMQNTSAPCVGCQFAAGRLDLESAVAAVPGTPLPTKPPTATPTKPPTSKPPTPISTGVPTKVATAVPGATPRMCLECVQVPCR